MLDNVKQGIGNTLTRFRKAINPIRWLGYVRPDELPQPSVLATQGEQDTLYLLEVAIQQRDTLEQTVLDLRERMDDCDCSYDDDN